MASSPAANPSAADDGRSSRYAMPVTSRPTTSPSLTISSTARRDRLSALVTTSVTASRWRGEGNWFTADWANRGPYDIRNSVRIPPTR
jgi:hypothetical protein